MSDRRLSVTQGKRQTDKWQAEAPRTSTGVSPTSRDSPDRDQSPTASPCKTQATRDNRQSASHSKSSDQSPRQSRRSRTHRSGSMADNPDQATRKALADTRYPRPTSQSQPTTVHPRRMWRGLRRAPRPRSESAAIDASRCAHRGSLELGAVNRPQKVAFAILYN